MNPPYETPFLFDTMVVIPVFNQLHFTRQCLQSLHRDEVPDRQIIVVDNASTDGTRDFLAGQPGLRLISNPANLGCSVAWNQGVEAAAPARWTVILNNDVIVAPGFLKGLVSFAEEQQHDIVSPAMAEGENDYDFDAFSGDLLHRMGTTVRAGTASGVCFMVHRRVFDSIGLFDTKVGLAGNEDEDFFRRARKAGFHLAVTGRAFLHHFGSITQKSVKAAMGLSNSARLSDKAYYRKKYRLHWLRRHSERLQEKTRSALWRFHEKRRFGLTLRMRRLEGKWHLS
jgi:N-acetylglucosaminyl-diphospho-decaprenol L-rhamnosyltransferase